MGRKPRSKEVNCFRKLKDMGEEKKEEEKNIQTNKRRELGHNESCDAHRSACKVRFRDSRFK